MAQSTSHIYTILLAVAILFIFWSVYSAAAQSSYPSGNLPCKTYSVTKMDCSNRNLLNIPVLDQNLTTLLDLSHNQLKNITNSPFEKLKVLLTLNMSYNQISQMSSTAFRGLKLLESLDLSKNKLVDVPKVIFSDMRNLLYLNLNFNWFTVIPDQALVPLSSLQYLYFINMGDICEIDLGSLENMTNLSILHIFINDLQTNISSNELYSLRKLSLHNFVFGWEWADKIYSISKDAFAPLTSNLAFLQIPFTALPAILSLQHPCQNLRLIGDAYFVQILDNSSLQILQKWNTSLQLFALTLLTLERVEDYAFTWISNLHILDLSSNKINYLAEDAFYGLNSLLQLILYDNSLTYLPSDVLEVFRKSGSLQYIDLSSNEITKRIEQKAFSAVSTSLSYLDLEINIRGIAYTDWIDLLQNLKHLTLTCLGYYGTVYITAHRTLPSLQTIHIINFDKVKFQKPLCILFPSIEVSMWSSYSQLVSLFPLGEAVQGCTFLKKLDLSGVLQNTNLADFKHLNITMFNLETLRLARNEIMSVKLFFFINAPTLKHLDVAGNDIKTIDSEIANKYSCLINLNMQDNELTSLSGLQHLTSLQNLNAASNEIAEIATWLLPETLQTLDLSNNPYHCTCKIEPFRNWISSDKKTFLQPGQYVCATPDNLKGISITAVELHCTSKATFYLSVTIPCVLLFCVLLIILYRYRWHIKYKLFLIYRNYHQFPNNDADFELLQLKYHAYVAYNENSAEDDAWVMDELQPNMEEGLEPLRLCMKSRDFTPGHFLLDSIDESIHQSRKTILVLSPNFVASEWCYHEMQMAQMRLLDDNLDVVVLVLLDAIPENKMTLSLRQLLCKKEYLKWPKNNVGQRLFWERLRQEIMGPVHVDRCFQR